MSGFVDTLLDSEVLLLSIDGRTFKGTLKSFDQRMNTILGNCVEHVYIKEGEPMQEEPLGVYMVRGDNIALISPIDKDLDNVAKENGIFKGKPIAPIQLH